MTTAEDFYEAIAHIGAGSLYYLMRRNGSATEYIFEPVILDTKNKEQTINILKRVMDHQDFIAFPGTPEAYSFMNEVGASLENK